MNAFWEGLVTIVLAIVGLAIVSALVSNKANTSGVLQAGFSGINNGIGVALSPVTGASYTPSLAYPTAGSTFGS